MAGLDVEALLDSAANSTPTGQNGADTPSSDRHKNERSERRDRDRYRDGSRDRDYDRKRRDRSRDRGRRSREMTGDGDRSPRSDRGSASGSLKSKRRSRSRDSDRRRDRRDRHRDSADHDEDGRGSRGDYYRGGGRNRSRSPDGDRYYRPSGRGRRDDSRDRGGRGRGRDGGRRRSYSPRRKASKSPSPQLTEDERDRRTVFVQQLAARLRTKELIAFFEKVGPVKEAQIVKDRVSGRSKGYVFSPPFNRILLTWVSVGYVEFKSEESVPLAIQLTGQKLLGIPIIAQLTEAEKNRQARSGEGTSSGASGVPFHRLYVGNIHFSITEQDLQNVFEPFGELEFVQLQKEEQGRSRGYGFVQ
jgi:RNA-binding protein 23/39